MNQTKLKIIAAVLIVFALLRFITLFTASPKAPPEAAKHFQVLGSTVAEETASRMGNVDVLLVLDESPTAHLKARESSFRQAARQQGLTLTNVVYTQSGDSHPERGWSTAFYNRIASEHPGVDIIVSFVGLPPLDLIRQPQRRSFTGSFVAVLPHEEYLNDFLATELVAFAVLPADSPSNDGLSIRVSDRIWFDMYYQIRDEPTAARQDPVTEMPPPEEFEFIDDYLTPLPPR